jgi:hypothetical protein
LMPPTCLVARTVPLAAQKKLPRRRRPNALLGHD